MAQSEGLVWLPPGMAGCDWRGFPGSDWSLYESPASLKSRMPRPPVARCDWWVGIQEQQSPLLSEDDAADWTNGWPGMTRLAGKGRLAF